MSTKKVGGEVWCVGELQTYNLVPTPYFKYLDNPFRDLQDHPHFTGASIPADPEKAPCNRRHDAPFYFFA